MGNVCPLCNGIDIVRAACDRCGIQLEDKGRIIDYFDDYSPYLEMEDMKKIDGIPNDYKKQKCPHLLLCPQCESESIFLVREI